MQHISNSNSLTATEQGAAPDRLQLRSSFLLTALPAAGELSRCAVRAILSLAREISKRISMVSEMTRASSFWNRGAALASSLCSSSRCYRLWSLVFFARLMRGFVVFMGTVKFDRTLFRRFASVWFLAGNSSVLAGLCLVLPYPGRGAVTGFRRTFPCPRSLVFSILDFRLRRRGSGLLSLCRCSIARFRRRLLFSLSVSLLGCKIFVSALAQGFGDSNSTGADVPTHGTTRRCTRPPTASFPTLVPRSGLCASGGG